MGTVLCAAGRLALPVYGNLTGVLSDAFAAH